MRAHASCVFNIVGCGEIGEEAKIIFLLILQAERRTVLTVRKSCSMINLSQEALTNDCRNDRFTGRIADVSVAYEVRRCDAKNSRAADFND